MWLSHLVFYRVFTVHHITLSAGYLIKQFLNYMAKFSMENVVNRPKPQGHKSFKLGFTWVYNSYRVWETEFKDTRLRMYAAAKESTQNNPRKT